MVNRHKTLFLLFLFILAGFLHVYPDFRFIHDLGDDYQGVPFMGAGDESVYLSRIAAVIYRNDLRLANVGLYEHQDDPILFPFLPEVIEGGVGKLLGLGVWQTDVWATFLLPVVLLFLIYLLVCGLSGSFRAGVLTALAIVLGYYWLTPNIGAILKLSPDYFSLSLPFARPVSPQFHFIPFILSLYLIYKISLKKSYYLVILSGLAVGILFYMSIYYWTFIYAGLAVLIIINLFRRKFILIRQYFLVLLVSGLVSAPYWVSYRSLSRLAHFSEIFARCGGIHTHKPIFPPIDIICLIFLIILYIPLFREKKEQFYYMVSFVSAGLICLNQQIITGKTMQSVHWQLYTNKTFIIICLFVSITFAVKRFKRVKHAEFITRLLNINFVFYIACFIFLTLGFIQQNFYYSARAGTYRKFQVMTPVLKYIHENTPLNSVILTDPFNFSEEWLISILTKNYPYISSSFFITSAIADKEIEERYFFALSFYGYSVSEAEGLFKYMNGGLFKGMQVHPRYGGTREANDAYINNLKLRYVKFINQGSAINLNKYRLDYVILAKKTQGRLLSDAKIASVLELAYSDGMYALYKIKVKNYE